MSKRTDKEFLLDMVISCKRILDYTAGMDCRNNKGAPSKEAPCFICECHGNRRVISVVLLLPAYG